MFRTLCKNELYVKKEKCSFAKEEVHFLSHVISQGTLQMDMKKVQIVMSHYNLNGSKQILDFLYNLFKGISMSKLGFNIDK